MMLVNICILSVGAAASLITVYLSNICLPHEYRTDYFWETKKRIKDIRDSYLQNQYDAASKDYKKASALYAEASKKMVALELERQKTAYR